MTPEQAIGGLALALLAAFVVIFNLTSRVRALEAGDVRRRRANGEWGPPPETPPPDTQKSSGGRS